MGCFGDALSVSVVQLELLSSACSLCPVTGLRWVMDRPMAGSILPQFHLLLVMFLKPGSAALAKKPFLVSVWAPGLLQFQPFLSPVCFLGTAFSYQHPDPLLSYGWSLTLQESSSWASSPSRGRINILTVWRKEVCLSCPNETGHCKKLRVPFRRRAIFR